MNLQFVVDVEYVDGSRRNAEGKQSDMNWMSLSSQIDREILY